MGYWFPPSPKAYDPVARPMRTKMLSREDAIAYLNDGDAVDRYLAMLSPEMRNGPVRVPDEYDIPLYHAIHSTPLANAKGSLGAYSMMLDTGPPASSSGSYDKAEQIGGWGSKTVPMTRWMYGNLPSDVYSNGQPIEGGLPADTLNPDGSITINYWDLSDNGWPFRKCITHGQGWNRVMFWHPQDRTWHEEGGDIEREAVQHFQEIMTIVMVVIRMVASATGVGAPAAALLGVALDMWKLGLTQVQIRGWEPPTAPISADQVYFTLGADFIGVCSAIGKSDAFGKIANDAGAAWTTMMTNAGGYPMLKGLVDVGNTVVGAGESSFKYINGLTKLATATGIKGIKCEPDDIKAFVKDMLSGNPKPTIVPIQSKLPDEPEGNPAILDSATDYRRNAWDAACLAFVEADPVNKLRIRRNAIMKWRQRSTIVAPSEQSAAARAIYESSESAVEFGIAFDQYLSQIYANAIGVQIRREVHPITITMEAGVATPQAKKDLDAVVFDLKRRYGMK